MTERTTYLDSGPRDRHARKIKVRASRWYATVELDRDEYVYVATSRGHDAALPAAFTEAVDRLRDAAVDRIWYDGYPRGFSYGTGPSSVILFVQFRYVDAAVAALRAAELDRDYGELHALADRLTLPVDDWLAPGERELVRGVDFDAQPGDFLNFLRGKAKKRGLRLNGRATAGSVWVRPVLPPVQRLIRETHPEQYPGWVDRWTGYGESDDAPIRPWVGGRGQDLSYGSKPVQFQEVRMPSGGACPCGMSLGEPRDSGKEHTSHHAAWAFGIPVPKSLEWWGDCAVVTTQASIAWRRLAYRTARIPRQEGHYDFSSWSHVGEPEVSSDNTRAYLLKANGYVIGYLAAHDTSAHRFWAPTGGSHFGDEDDTQRPRIILIWVADAYRRRGVGAKLVQALASDSGRQVADVSWSTPISDAGRHLARGLSPDGIWVS
ncbi:GNAT family N-acetyltransferase [Streptomyces sp. NBC_01102]|uniref:GNAT family N-acetyltransferase n=1 Tax=Streptomyces sp. NBC_01102 TaxID=2903749 RepID=UPI00386D0EB6|nr:GNAT family N-acetyltransferase [Streptomyces sp. NBC_01102]